MRLGEYLSLTLSFFATKGSEVSSVGFDTAEDFALSAFVSVKTGSVGSYFKTLWKPSHLLDNKIEIMQLLPVANHETIHE
jgi:hypothetical protein